jgi:tetrathionate reductase subunit B
MTRYGVLIEADRCIGCDVCVYACKDEFEDHAYPPYSAAQPVTQYGYSPKDYPEPSSKLTPWIKPGNFWINTQNVVSGKYPNISSVYIPKRCMECDDAPCIKASSNGAIYKSTEGLVIIDPVKSVGQKQLVDSCPYGQIYWNEEANMPQACTGCAHLIAKGKKPRCVESCPLGVMTFGDLDDANSDISHKISLLKAKQLNPELGTKPKIYYTGLP